MHGITRRLIAFAICLILIFQTSVSSLAVESTTEFWSSSDGAFINYDAALYTTPEPYEATLGKMAEKRLSAYGLIEEEKELEEKITDEEIASMMRAVFEVASLSNEFGVVTGSETLEWARKNHVATNVQLLDPTWVEKQCTYAEAITLLWNLSGSPKSNLSGDDINIAVSDEAKPAILWAMDHSICTTRIATGYGFPICVYKYDLISGDQLLFDNPCLLEDLLILICNYLGCDWGPCYKSMFTENGPFVKYNNKDKYLAESLAFVKSHCDFGGLGLTTYNMTDPITMTDALSLIRAVVTFLEVPTQALANITSTKALVKMANAFGLYVPEGELTRSSAYLIICEIVDKCFPSKMFQVTEEVGPPTAINIQASSNADAEVQIQKALKFIPKTLHIEFPTSEIAWEFAKQYYNGVPAGNSFTFIDAIDTSEQTPLSVTVDGTTVTVKVQYSSSWRAYADIQDWFVVYVSNLYSNELSTFADMAYQQGRYIVSDLARAELVRSIVSQYCEYDSKSAEYIKTNQRTNKIASQLPFGLIVNKTAVCQGYAYAYSFLIKLLGGHCVEVNGKKTSKSNQWTAHCWNKIFIRENWFNIDCTKADNIGSSQLSYFTDNDFFIYSGYRGYYQWVTMAGQANRYNAAKDSI